MQIIEYTEPRTIRGIADNLKCNIIEHDGKYLQTLWRKSYEEDKVIPWTYDIKKAAKYFIRKSAEYAMREVRYSLLPTTLGVLFSQEDS